MTLPISWDQNRDQPILTNEETKLLHWPPRLKIQGLVVRQAASPHCFPCVGHRHCLFTTRGAGNLQMSLVSFTVSVLATLQFMLLLSSGILSPRCHCLSVLIPDFHLNQQDQSLPVSVLPSVKCGPSVKVLGHQKIPAFRDEHTAPSGWSHLPCHSQIPMSSASFRAMSARQTCLYVTNHNVSTEELVDMNGYLEGKPECLVCLALGIVSKYNMASSSS